jgi:hypothetical protein
MSEYSAAVYGLAELSSGSNFNAGVLGEIVNDNYGTSGGVVGKINNSDWGSLGYTNGSSYWGVFSNSNLYVGGKEAIGTGAPINALDVNGAVAIGTYAGDSTAPANGLAVSGNVGIGTTNPQAKLDVEVTTYPLTNYAIYGNLWATNNNCYGIYGVVEQLYEGNHRFGVGGFINISGLGNDQGGVYGGIYDAWGSLGYRDVNLNDWASLHLIICM